MPAKKNSTAGRKAARVSEPTKLLAFGGDTLLPLVLPVSKKRGFDADKAPNEAVRVQTAWQGQFVYDNADPSYVPDRKRLLLGLTFVFPDDPNAMGQFDPNFTCRTYYAMLHYIMHQYAWPESVKARFPGGVVRFHDLSVLDHNNAFVHPAHYDAMLLDLRRLEIPPLGRTPINLTVLCYKFEMRVTSVSITLCSLGGDRVVFVREVSHQTFLQLSYIIHRHVDRVSSFYTNQDRVCIMETLLNGSTHEVTHETYGTRIYSPEDPMHVEFICRALP
jgi:hypothetical protein